MKLKNIVELYRASPQWLRLAPSSRNIYTQGFGYLSDFMEMDADKITRPMILDLRDKLYDKRGVCRVAMTVLNVLLSYAYDRGMCQYNHAKGIKHLPKQIPWKRWKLSDVVKVLEIAPRHIRHAITLALFTGQRRCDLIKMQWDNYDGKYIHIIQRKTKKALAIPVHPILKEELAIMEEARGTSPYILTHSYGDGWQEAALSRAVTKWAKAAGVEGHVLHGLRKSTASCLAELGCTPHEIAAITGQSIVEVMAYTEEANQKRLAENAMGRWK